MADTKIDDLEAETIKVVSAYCRREVTLDTKLISDLNLDSLDSAELVAEIESHFNVVIPMEKLPEIKTVQDIADNLAILVTPEQAFESSQ